MQVKTIQFDSTEELLMHLSDKVNRVAKVAHERGFKGAFIVHPTILTIDNKHVAEYGILYIRDSKGELAISRVNMMMAVSLDEKQLADELGAKVVNVPVKTEEPKLLTSGHVKLRDPESGMFIPSAEFPDWEMLKVHINTGSLTAAEFKNKKTGVTKSLQIIKS